MELTREAARRFNDLYGRRKTDDAKIASLLESLPKEDARYLKSMAKKRTEQGDETVLAKLPGFLAKFDSLGADDKALLTSFVSGKGKVVLIEPDVLLTSASKLPGLDGRKMSKSYGNAIGIREDAASITKKVREMPTDPARVRRSDKGDPTKCPVWQFHLVYSDENRKKWVTEGCTSAGIGCIECKKTVSDAILEEQQPMLERAQPYVANPARVREIIDAGCQRAQSVARQTMADVRHAMGLQY